MDSRLRSLAEQLDANQIARREFLRKAAIITGGTTAGLSVLNKMAHAQAKTKLRVWLFKSFVTGANEVIARHIEAWAKEKNVDVEMDWATFGDREQKFVAAIEAGNPPDIAEMNIYGPMRYKAALRDVTKVATDVAGAKGGLLPFAERAMKADGKFLAVGRYSMTTAQGLRSGRGGVRQEGPGSRQGSLGLRPDAQPLRRRRRLHVQHPVELRRRRLGQGRQARDRHLLPEAERGRAAVCRRHHPEA
jgi:hypothetical protein